MDHALAARLLAIDIEHFEAVRQTLGQEVHSVAERLLADPQVLRRIDALPFAPGSTVVGLGDSPTGDSRS